MARYKISRVISLRIPLDDYDELIEKDGTIAPILRALIKKHLNRTEQNNPNELNELNKLNNNIIEFAIPDELVADWLKIPENTRKSGIRAYIKNASKIFKE